MKALYAQYLKFPSDTNGNSRRGWWFTAQDGQPLGWFAEECNGKSAVVDLLPRMRAYRANDVFEERDLTPEDVDIPCHLLDGADTFGILPPAIYRRLASQPLITTCKGAEIVTTGGVPVFGVRRWWRPRAPSAPGVDVCVPHPSEEITERVAIERLAKGHPVIADAWCPSYRGFCGEVRIGRAALEVTRI